VKRLLVLAAVGVVLLVAVVAGTYFYFARDLPSVESLRHYNPPQVSKVTCADGSICAEFYSERRTVIDANTLPAHVRNAFLAAEDAEFYHHDGLDYVGMIRAGIKAFLPGGHMTGASTITQQACRNILLSQERTLSRKIREWILSLRMEKALTKDEILNLYVNQIYFGHLRYGVEEAALYYFGKHAKDLTIGEAASVAGTVQSPERINPVTNMVRAKKRQVYVLHQLAKHGFLTTQQVQPWIDRPIELAPPPPKPVGPYYVEEIRKTLVDRYGDKMVRSGGLRVQIAMRPDLQKKADEAVRDGLELVDHRMGFKGPLGTMEAARFAALRPLIEARIEKAGRRKDQGELVADLAPLATDEAPDASREGVEEASSNPDEVDTASADEKVARKVALEPLHEGLRLGGYVTRVDDRTGKAEVDLVGRTAQIAFGTIGWARKRGVNKWTPAPKHISDVLEPGMLVRVKILGTPAAPEPLPATLDQIPEVQGALVAIDPKTREVVAMTGGYDFRRSAFNRATQAHRQPGSSFKPFVYGAAMLSQRFTPISMLNDAPEPIRDPWTGKVWQPRNYERDGFAGPMSLTKALAESKNTIAVRLVEALQPDAPIDFARRAGIRSEIPKNFTLALGTGDVYPLEIANAYATLDALGKYAEPVTLKKVQDASGRVLEEHHAAFEETIPPPAAYLVTHMLQAVVEDPEGTGRAVRVLERPVAAKTGTTSDCRDAWFDGYTPDMVAVAYVGFDDHKIIGRAETGARAALPIWLEFMKAAEDGKPVRDFDVPPGITQVRIDPRTGLLAGTAVPGRMEPFLDGTAPTALAPAPGQVTTDSFFLQDQGSGL
jgi:penicillin-binding protein 1A